MVTVTVTVTGTVQIMDTVTVQGESDVLICVQRLCSPRTK